jgi:hypothetical protein
LADEDGGIDYGMEFEPETDPGFVVTQTSPLEPTTAIGINLYGEE